MRFSSLAGGRGHYSWLSVSAGYSFLSLKFPKEFPKHGQSGLIVNEIFHWVFTSNEQRGCLSWGFSASTPWATTCCTWLDSVRSCFEFEQPFESNESKEADYPLCEMSVFPLVPITWYRNKMDMTCLCYPPWRKPGLLCVPTGQQLESSIDNSASSMQRRVATWLRGAWSVIMNYMASEQCIRTTDTSPCPRPFKESAAPLY